MDIMFEPLEDKHRQRVIDILNYYIETTTAAFREDIVDYSHFDKIIDKNDVYSGYAIIIDGRELIGFCTLETFKNIRPFKKTAEVMYFIKKEYIGKGIGKRTLQQLEDDAKNIGISKIVVDITDDNKNSLTFHERNGFREYGRLKNCWRKFGKDLGIVYMEKDI